MPKVYCTSFDSKIGHIYIASTDSGVCKISIPKESKKDFFDWLSIHFDDDDVVENKSRNKEAIDQLNRYFNGKLAKFSAPVDQIGTAFQLRVWKELLRIPYGTTITYKQLARRVGYREDSGQSARPTEIIRSRSLFHAIALSDTTVLSPDTRPV